MSNITIDIIEEIKLFTLAGNYVLPNNKWTIILEDLTNIIIIGSPLGEKT